MLTNFASFSTLSRQILAGAVISFPLMVRTIRVAFQGFDIHLEAASCSLGKGPVSTFCRISLPLAFRGVLARAVLGFARTLGEFGATIRIAGNIPGQTQTIPTAVFSLVQSAGGVERSTPLILISMLLACAALGLSNYLERRSGRHKVS